MKANATQYPTNSRGVLGTLKNADRLFDGLVPPVSEVRNKRGSLGKRKYYNWHWDTSSDTESAVNPLKSTSLRLYPDYWVDPKSLLTTTKSVPARPIDPRNLLTSAISDHWRSPEIQETINVPSPPPCSAEDALPSLPTVEFLENDDDKPKLPPYGVLDSATTRFAKKSSAPREKKPVLTTEEALEVMRKDQARAQMNKIKNAERLRRVAKENAEKRKREKAEKLAEVRNETGGQKKKRKR
jgi:hypothetical protein